MADEEIVECTWVVKNVKRIYEDKLSIRSPVFSTSRSLSGITDDDFKWRFLMSTQIKENVPGCYEVTKEKQYIALYLQNMSVIFVGSLLRITFSIIKPIEGKIISKSKTIFNCNKNDHSGIQNFISIPKLEKLHLEDLIIKCEIEEIEMDFDEFKPLMNNKIYSDIELLVGDKKYPAHKMVLALNCEVFREQFYLQDSLSEIKLGDMNPEVFHELLKFMYTGTVEYLDEITCQLFKVAVKYLMYYFLLQLMFVLKVHLNVENVIPHFIHIQDYFNEDLKREKLMRETFSEFIFDNIETIIKLEKFPELVRIAPGFVSHILALISLSRKDHGYKKDESWQRSKNLGLKDKVNSEKLYESFVNDKTFSDVEIHVGDQKYYAHKIFLAARSPVFKSMFSHNMMEAVSGMVKVEDMETEVFDQMLRFIYTSEVEVNAKTEDFIRQLFIAADRYEITDLKRECEVILVKKMAADNVFNTLQLAYKLNAEGLKNECLEYVLDHFCLGQDSKFREKSLNAALAASHPHLLLDLLTMVTVNYKPL